MKMHEHLIALSISLAVFTVHGAAFDPAEAKTLQVVASFTVLADVVSKIGGDHVSVRSLVGPNGDPHEFEPSPADAQALKAADVVFVSGLGLEGWMDRLIGASGYQGAAVVVSQGIKTREMQEDGKLETDPHVWNSPVNVLSWVDNIEKSLIAADPVDRANYAKNAENYRRQLNDLNAYAHTLLDEIPPNRRKILTSHDAFGYFGREFGVTFLSPVGLSTETEASAKDVAALVDQIKAEGVTRYFFENSSDPRLVKQIAATTGATDGGELYVESLSDAAGPAPTYTAMFKYNAEKLASAMRP